MAFSDPPGALLLLLTGLVIVEACVILVLLFACQRQFRRHERLREETAEALKSIFDDMVDINTRLVAAGYPPGQVRPRSSYPAWAPVPRTAANQTEGMLRPPGMPP